MNRAADIAVSDAGRAPAGSFGRPAAQRSRRTRPIARVIVTSRCYGSCGERIGGLCCRYMSRHSSHLLALARRGAEVRLRELAQEAGHLLAIFPHLRDSFDADELPVSFIIAEGARRSGAAPTRPRAMSAAARRAEIDHMKKAWKTQRKGEQK